MARTVRAGWESLIPPKPPFRGEGRFPVAAYSEFMPGPYVALKPYGGIEPHFFSPEDPWGFPISEYELAHELRPGLVRIAERICHEVRRLAAGEHTLSKALFAGNPYWPPALSARAGSLPVKRYLLILPLALSRTLDDKGRVRWTFFGSSERGPSRPFWQSFRTEAGTEVPEESGTRLLRRLLSEGCGAPAGELADLHRAGFRILPVSPHPDAAARGEDPIPSWARAFLLGEEEPLEHVRYLLTFRSFAHLPKAAQQAYLDGKLELLPFPGSLVFFGHPGYRKLTGSLEHAEQVALLHLFPGRHEAPTGIRIPQSGWLDEPHPTGTPPQQPAYAHGPIVSHIRRTSRWDRIHRDQDPLVSRREDRVAHVLFSSDPELLGLYGKPMARNCQIWSHEYELVLDGPRQGREEIVRAARALAAGGHFGYRFQFPPMRVGRHEIYWHLPLCAWIDSDAAPEAPPVLIEDGPTGYLTAYPRGGGRGDDMGAGGDALADSDRAVELWPRIARREPHLDAVEMFGDEPGHRRHTTTYNIRKILEAHELLGGGRLRRSFARRLLTVPEESTLEDWLESLPGRALDSGRGRRIVRALRERLFEEDPPLELTGGPAAALPGSLTFDGTATRAFEERYWNTIASLAEGPFVNKDNADLTGPRVPRRAHRDLEALGDDLHRLYREAVARHGMEGTVLVGDHRFRWQTDFDFSWSEGWSQNQTGAAHERNIVVVIPGRNRSEAVVMADHYDTAYMEDVYENRKGKSLGRRAAAGADDNHSATAALLAAADALLPLARAGRLRRDVWLVHLTGEEFPSDCMGARHLVQALVEGDLVLEAGASHAGSAGRIDLSNVRVRGAFILDMIAHNNDKRRYVFQIAPGEGPEAMRLAARAHLANERWNRSASAWNRAQGRDRRGPSERMERGTIVPAVVAHPELAGEIRPSWHFTSSLYNTDAQILSDAGIPVVLFMEDYDLNRVGYHDTNDTMMNIDLDYGAALAAIGIETVADCAAAEEP